MITNLNYVPGSMDNLEAPNPKKQTQMFQVDGEGLLFDDKITIEV